MVDIYQKEKERDREMHRYRESQTETYRPNKSGGWRTKGAGQNPLVLIYIFNILLLKGLFLII